MRATALILTLVTALAGDATTRSAPSVMLWTNDLLSSFVNQRTDQITKYFSAETNLNFNSNELPIGGTFTGADIALFFKKLELMGTFSGFTYQIEGIDEAKGIALVGATRTVQFTRSGGQTSFISGASLEWNVLTGKLINIHVGLINESEVLDAYYTRAERLYWNMVNAFWRRGTVTLSLNDPMWNYIADDIVVDVRMHPQGFLNKQVYRGKADVLGMFTELRDRMLSAFGGLEHKNLVDWMIRRSIKHNILFSDDNTIVVYCKVGKFEAVKRITFRGDLVSKVEDLVLPLYPWNLYKYPTLIGGEGGKESDVATTQQTTFQQTPMVKPVQQLPAETVGVKPIMTEAPLPIQAQKAPATEAPQPVLTQAPQPIQGKTLPIETAAPVPVKQTEAPLPVLQGKEKTMPIEHPTEAPQPIQGKASKSEPILETAKPVQDTQAPQPIQNVQQSTKKGGRR